MAFLTRQKLSNTSQIGPPFGRKRAEGPAGLTAARPEACLHGRIRHGNRLMVDGAEAHRHAILPVADNVPTLRTKPGDP
jgi:hypothetical protein